MMNKLQYSIELKQFHIILLNNIAIRTNYCITIQNTYQYFYV